MSRFSLRLPDSLREKVRELAEKISALTTEEYLNERAKRASREKFERALAQVPGVESEERDRLEP